MGWLILILLIVEVIVLAVADRILFGTYITPITVLSVPYLLVVLLAILIGPALGFLPFFYPSLWVWIIGLPIFWIPGFILSAIFLQKTNIFNYPYSSINSTKLDNLILNLSLLAILILISGLIKSYNISKVGSEIFRESFGSGLSGHTLIISKLFFIYLIVRFRKINLLPIGLLLGFYFLYGVKGWIFIPLLSGILIRILLKKTKINFSLISKILVFGIIVFYIVYRLALGPTMPLNFVFVQFFRYAFAGVLGLSEFIKHQGEFGIGPSVIINPIINLYLKISGSGIFNKYDSVNTFIGADMNSNVKTIFGTIYLYAGLTWGCVFTLLVGAISYLFLILTIKTHNIIFLIIYGTFLTMFLFGFFDTYSSNLFFYEFPIFGIVLYFTYPILIKLRIK